MLRTLRSHCRGHGFNPWSGNQDPTYHVAQPREGKKKKDESACPQAILVSREDQYKACGMSEGEKHIGTFLGGSFVFVSFCFL